MIKLAVQVTLALLFLLSVPAFSQTTGLLSQGQVGISCNAVTASTSNNPGTAGGCTSLALLTSGGNLPGIYTWQVITTGSPTGLTVTLNGSLDGTTWTQLGTTSSAATNTTSSTAAYRFLGCIPSTLSGGTSPTATCQISVTAAPAATWNTIGNAVGGLTLANGTNATTFNQTSAANWTWANTTAATSGTSQSSPILNINGTYWTGAASAADSWTMQDVVGNGTNGTSLLTFAHSGTTGAAAVQVSNLQASGHITNYNSESTAGLGVAYMRGATLQRAETGADANLLTVTPASAVGLYRITVQFSVSAVNTPTLGWTATWTDSDGHAQAPTNLPTTRTGVAAGALTQTPAANNTFYGEVIIDVNNSGTNIVVSTTFSGTSIAYNASAMIERLD